MAPEGDTIVAPATPMGESALAIVRLSGPLCCEVIADALDLPYPTPRVASYRPYRMREGGVLDRCVCTFYQNPASYTGEDLVELSVHGNPLIVQSLVEDLIARGCRAAEPGEFTRRAFLNGKMDLPQAEAVLDVIHARSEQALKAAQRQLEGSVGAAVNRLLERLLGVIAHIEAYIDFPEEDLPPESEQGPISDLVEIKEEARRLAGTSHHSTLLRDGARTVIAGLPNAGKSSLLNLLVGDERAIVSSEPGTTRDYIEERLVVGPYLLRVVDTAGLREGASEIESKGIEKTLAQVEHADLVLLVVDSAEPSPALHPRLEAALARGDAIVVENKADLPDAISHRDFLPSLPHVSLSALRGAGVDSLQAEIIKALEGGLQRPGQDDVLVSARHAEALRVMGESLESALQLLREGDATELAASELRSALAALEQILGKVDNERMLDRLFASFCIGK